MNILEQIVNSTKARVFTQKRQVSLKEMQKKAQQSQAQNPQKPFVFEKALAAKDMAFICEVKKASPSKGVIAQHYPYVEIAKSYAAAGAAAISVLTEPQYFLGDAQHLADIHAAVATPLLRKDFTLDAYQIYQAAAIGASAILLICAVLSRAEIKAYISLADQLGMACLVEAHSKEELKTALDAGARIVGVNNRNLKDFSVDFENSLRLRQMVPQNVIFVAESGIKTPADVARLKAGGINAVLVGESLMAAKDKKEALAFLMGEKHDQN